MSKRIGVRKQIALELHRKMRQNQIREHALRTLFWECTLRCNIACKHCGSDCKVSAHQPDMPIVDFLKVIDEMTPFVEPNKLLVIFSGGEPLVRDDLEQCGIQLYRRGYPWGMVTNGLYLSRERLDSLLAAGLHSITVSLDGFEEDHNWLRGHLASYRKALAAVKMLIGEKEIVWDIVTCANRRNLGYLRQFRDFLIETGLPRWRLFTIFPVGRAARHPEFQLSDADFTTLLDFIKETREEGKIHVSYGCEGFLGPYEAEVRDSFYQCQAGTSVASILADGSISGCLSIRSNFHQGNIYQDSFIDVWNNCFNKYRDRSWTRKGTCADCKVFRYCEGNGMHLYDDNENLLVCHYNRITH